MRVSVLPLSLVVVTLIVSVLFLGLWEWRRICDRGLVSYAWHGFLQPRYLIALALAAALSTWVGTLVERTPSGSQAVRPGAVFFPMFHILISLFQLVAQLMWVSGFFRLGRRGLFSELALTPSRAQDVVVPFFWMMFLYTGALGVLELTAVQLICPPEGEYSSAVLQAARNLSLEFFISITIFYGLTRGWSIVRAFLTATLLSLAAGYLQNWIGLAVIEEHKAGLKMMSAEYALASNRFAGKGMDWWQNDLACYRVVTDVLFGSAVYLGLWLIPRSVWKGKDRRPK